jgi:hypothetical protein
VHARRVDREREPIAGTGQDARLRSGCEVLLPNTKIEQHLVPERLAGVYGR